MSNLYEIMNQELANGLVGLYFAKILHDAGIHNWGAQHITPEGIEKTLLSLCEHNGAETGWLFVHRDPEDENSVVYGIKLEFTARGS